MGISVSQSKINLLQDTRERRPALAIIAGIHPSLGDLS
jgi:hypothetical protein